MSGCSSRLGAQMPEWSCCACWMPVRAVCYGSGRDTDAVGAWQLLRCCRQAMLISPVHVHCRLRPAWSILLRSVLRACGQSFTPLALHCRLQHCLHQSTPEPPAPQSPSAQLTLSAKQWKEMHTGGAQASAAGPPLATAQNSALVSPTSTSSATPAPQVPAYPSSLHLSQLQVSRTVVCLMLCSPPPKGGPG